MSRAAAWGHHWVRLAAAGCGVLAVAAAAVEARPQLGWVALPGFVGAVGVAWRRTRWLAGLTALSALALVVDGRTTSTAVLVGALLVGSVLLTDLIDTADLPDLSVSLPSESSVAEGPVADAPRTEATGAGAAAGWARSAGVVWLAGVGAAVVVAVVASSAALPAAALVALAPVLAVLAGLVALNRGRA